jgi:hypothetical protein
MGDKTQLCSVYGKGNEILEGEADGISSDQKSGKSHSTGASQIDTSIAEVIPTDG